MSGPELLGAAAVVADQIADRPAEGPVAVLAEPTAHAIVAMVGGLLAGAPVVPVPPDVGSGERAHLLADSGASLWIGERPTDVTLPVRKVDLSRRSGDVAREAPHDGPALVLYTSGTTGAPKGVLLSRAAMARGPRRSRRRVGVDRRRHPRPRPAPVPRPRAGPRRLRRAAARLAAGARRTATPDLYASAVRDHGASLLFGVPTIWSRIAADPAAADALRSARLLVSGSAPLPVPVFEQLRELTGQAPVERYGMSETMITLSVRADGERRPGWVGVPVAGVETRLVSTDEETDGELLPHDGESIGELQVRGPGLFTATSGGPRPRPTRGRRTAGSAPATPR